MSITPIKSKSERLADKMKDMNCPFRKRVVTRANGTTEEYFMPCDPECIALIHQSDYTAYSCLRLVQARYTANKLCIASSGVDEEDDD